MPVFKTEINLTDEQAATFAEVEAEVAKVMALGELSDEELLAALAPLRRIVLGPRFRSVYRAVIQAAWWTTFVARHGDALTDRLTPKLQEQAEAIRAEAGEAGA